MKRSKVRRDASLTACAQYLIDSEWDDFKEYVLDGNDPYQHIYSSAFIALNGQSQFETMLKTENLA